MPHRRFRPRQLMSPLRTKTRVSQRRSSSSYSERTADRSAGRLTQRHSGCQRPRQSVAALSVTALTPALLLLASHQMFFDVMRVLGVLSLGLTDHLAPRVAGLFDRCGDLFARIVRRFCRRLELFAAVGALDGHPERPETRVDETRS